MKNKLLEILKSKPSMVNLSRVIKKQDKELYDWVMSNPINYPKDIKFNERVYSIENNISDIPKDENNKNRRFINYYSGYSGLCNIEPTLENILKLKDLAIKNTAGFISKYRVLYDKVFELTNTFEEDSSFSERLYCLENKIDQKPLVFINYNKGYSDKKFISKLDKKLEQDKLNKEYLRLANRTNSTDIEHGKSLYLYREKHKRFNEELDSFSEDREGIDYLFEPVLEIRSIMIRSNYVTNILKMDVSEYDKLYPNKRGRCKSSVEGITNKLNELDEDGVSAYDRGKILRVEKLKTPDENGVTGYQKIGMKTKSTHMSNIDEDGKNGYQRIAETRVEAQEALKDTLEEDFKRKYKNLTRFLSGSWRDNLPSSVILGRCGTEDAQQLDHKFSVMDGYRNSISPYVISNIENMTILTWKENLSKGNKSSIAIEELYKITNYNEDKNKTEMDIVSTVIREYYGKNITSRKLDTLIRNKLNESKSRIE